ncbi:hypothetical protein bcgnr5378_65780 [Bacillus cereus]|nr:hypothetical protein [Bacillus cereus]
MLGLGNNSYKKLLFPLLGGTFMFYDDEPNSHENDQIEELKTFSIEESVKMKKEQRNRRNEAYYKKINELKKRSDELKQQIKDERT